MTSAGQHNFLPPADRAARRSRRIVRPIVTIGSVYLALLAAAAVGISLIGTTSTASAVQAITVQADLDRTTASLHNVRLQLTAMERELAAVRRVTAQPDISLLLPIVAQQVCVDGTLRDLRVEPAGEGKGRELIVSLRGFTRSYASASALALRLERVNLFKSVQLQRTDLQLVGAEESVSFDIRCTLEGGGL
ncbi:MAG TPA: PilN domain-containing protein [Tepidisphaeraceae bacterium]|jgi:hypothetical protein|nr:PilN domain-containing protein [Tepidisphaeraceae bacterium]